MNMERVKEIEEQLQYAVQHQTLPGRWSHNIGELIEIIKQQQEQMERYEKALKEITNVGWSESFGGCHSFTGENHAKCIDLAEKALDQ